MAEQIKVNAALFRACAECQSRKETRYYIGGVYVQPHPTEGATLVATDGHVMLVAHDKSGLCKSPAIVKLEADAFRAVAKNPTVEPSISIDDKGIASCGNYRSEKSTFIDGVYPDWPRVISPIVELAKKRFYGKPQFDVASFNAKLLGVFAKVASHLGLQTPSLRLVAFGKADPALVLYPDKPHAFGIIMPMRTTDIDSAVPAFMRPILEPKPAKKIIAPRPSKSKPKRKAA